jgi:drug/metabolite transporter (DMT)-like permease
LTGYHEDGVTFKTYLGGYLVLVLAYAAIYIIWGTTYLAIRVAVGTIPPLLMMGIRCVTAGGLLLAWAALRGDRTTWRHWAHAAVAGALMFGVCHGGLAWAEQRIASGLTALLAATTPLWLVLFEWAGGRRPGAGALAGLAVGAAGVVLLVGGTSSGAFALTPVLAVLTGTIAWAAGSLYARPPRVPASLALGAGMPLAWGGVLLLTLSWRAHEFGRVHPAAISPASLLALVYLVVFGSIVAFSAYAWLLRVAPAWRVGTHEYVNPIIAVALGALVAREPVTPTIVASSVVIAASVALVLASKGGRSSCVKSARFETCSR